VAWLQVRIKIESISLALCIAPIAVLFAFLVGFRGEDVGVDTLQYKSIINSFFDTGVSRHEIGFKLLLYFFGFFSRRPEFIFSCIFLVVFLCMLKAFSNFLEEDSNRSAGFFFFLGCLFLSDWFLVATTNGLRQGLSLAVLYLAISYWPKSRWAACTLTCVACLFHYATVLVVLFFPLVLLGVTELFTVFLTLMLLYAFGVNEYVFKVLSAFLSIDIYDRIVSYGGDSARWVGFQAAFVIYTVFWGGVFYFSSLTRWSAGPRAKFAYKIYLVLSIPLFVYGFGGYSNRYGYMAWLYLPVCQALILFSTVKVYRLRICLAFFLLFLGVAVFSIKLHGWGVG